MAVTSNVNKFVARTQAFGANMAAAEKAGLHAAAGATKKAVLTSARAHGWKPTGGWVGIKVLPSARQVELRGARAYWAERGTKPHSIEPKTKQAVLTPMGPRKNIQHPGAKARPFWAQGVAAATVIVPKAMANGVRGALLKTFGN